MGEDKLDEAIDAVVRAVDRIERATRDAGLQPQQPQSAAGDAPAAAPVTAGSDEFYALVGRLVGQAQQLDAHLAAAGELRSEITTLVARLAATAPR